MKYVTIGSTLSGNKGAASILEAALQAINARDPGAEFTVLTVYPEEDSRLNPYKNVRILSAKPLLLGLIINPLALLHKILPPLRPLIRKNKQIRAIAEADVLLDHGGIAFVDGREKFLIYNVATMLPAILLGTRIVKCSQAMGPFGNKINRFLAKLILPRIDVICARGEQTYKHLRELGMSNILDATDIAFLLESSKEETVQADQVLKKSQFSFGQKGKTIGVLPSEVVRKKVDKKGRDYTGYNVEFINRLLDQGYHVLLIAYSAREGKETRHNNDLPVCRAIATRIQHENFTFIDKELSAQQLRAIISKLDIIVASRFHAMVAALSVATPPLIIGWSHKYAEVMDKFGLQKAALGYEALSSPEVLLKAFTEMADNRQKAKENIVKSLPAVKKNAARQVEAIVTKK